MSKDTTFWIRFRSSVVLTIVTVAAILEGKYALWAVLLAVTLIGMMELYRTMGVNKKPIAFVGYTAAVIWFGLILLDYISKHSMASNVLDAVGSGLSSSGLFLPLTVVFLIAVLAFYVLSFPKYNSEQTTMVFFGLFYVAVTLSYIFRLRTMDGGAYIVWLIFIGSWGADTSAYLVGRKIGKHKIVPVLSPKKSLEGFIGGAVGSVLLSFIYTLIFRNQLGEVMAHPFMTCGVTVAVSALVSMIGDLAASAIKRDKNIKDYGKLIPGHGGILDRFDSVIYVAPVVYYLVSILA